MLQHTMKRKREEHAQDACMCTIFHMPAADTSNEHLKESSLVCFLNDYKFKLFRG